MALAWAKDLVKEIAPFFKGNSLHLQQSVEFNARGTTKKQWIYWIDVDYIIAYRLRCKEMWKNKQPKGKHQESRRKSNTKRIFAPKEPRLDGFPLESKLLLGDLFFL